MAKSKGGMNKTVFESGTPKKTRQGRSTRNIALSNFSQ
jgi:hypothetical protein